MDLIKVAADSRVSATAGAIAGAVRRCGQANVRAIGAGAVNQAIKAVAIARRYLVPEGVDIACVPSFVDLQIRGQERTAISLLVETRSATSAAEEAPPLRLAVEPDGAGGRSDS
jgi:stage V sporulation protein S